MVYEIAAGVFFGLMLRDFFSSLISSLRRSLKWRMDTNMMRLLSKDGE
jgi:hypothetical protein